MNLGPAQTVYRSGHQGPAEQPGLGLRGRGAFHQEGLRGTHRLLPGNKWTDSPLALSLSLFSFNRSKDRKRDQGKGRRGGNEHPASSHSLSTALDRATGCCPTSGPQLLPRPTCPSSTPSPQDTPPRAGGPIPCTQLAACFKGEHGPRLGSGAPPLFLHFPAFHLLPSDSKQGANC